MEPERQYNLLIVDDEERLLRVLRLGLKPLGFEIHTASNGEEALKLLYDHPWDLILTDVKMPRMMGDEFVLELERLGVTVPIVVMTAYADVESAVKTLKHGAVDYIKKPFSVEELAEVLFRVLKKAENKPQADVLTLKEGVADQEKELIKKALLKAKNNKSKAAKILNISERALFYKIKKYELSDTQS